MKVTVCRKSHFNAAHRLHNPAWSAEQNARFFGKCNNPHYHGHNYDIVVKVSGRVDPDSGYVMDMKVLDDIIRAEIVERFDHRNLNLDCPEFANLNPTAENIAIVAWNLLRRHIGMEFGLTVVLFETERNFVEYAGD